MGCQAQFPNLNRGYGFKDVTFNENKLLNHTIGFNYYILYYYLFDIQNTLAYMVFSINFYVF